MQFQGNALGSATGFVVERGGSKYLITNFHVVSGRHPDTHTSIRPDGAWPDSIQIVHNAAGRLGHWIPKSEQLYDTMGVPLWFEHPVHRSQVDVVALPLTDTVGIDVHAHDPWASPRVAIQMAGPLSIIGFPFGTAYAGAMAIWVQGFVASEWAMDFGNLPRFLIDSRTREGQSGSPVIFYNVGGGFQDLRGNIGIGGGPFEELMGVYSGRISQESDLGFVWKVSCVREVVQGRVRGTVRGP
jgi:hypothetical protein